MQNWFDNLWNNSPWILTGIIIVLLVQVMILFVWEFYLRDWILEKNSKLIEDSK